MAYETDKLLPFSFVAFSGSTITKTFAAHDHIDTQQQNQCQMQLILQKTLKCAVLHNIVHPQDALIAIFLSFGCEVTFLSAQHRDSTVALWYFFPMWMSP